ncbi:hypothetical protein L596_023236 [Steinernema carpocapsae]|uniref:Cullin family profile domain-containing protein n=1 Tax=Steinernema carpocapsae TaxID=34508 RepID=A0A4U5MD31_STECR|nr:hypothetical protein L596_023236 [Steinernema carpocapsae]
MSYVNHNTMKKLVQDAVLDILSEKRGVAYSYAELYKASFELCNQGQGRQLHKLVQDAIAEYMNKYAANVEESDREGNLLGVLLKFWTSFTTALLMVDDVLFYLYGHLKVERVSVIGLTLFREGIFKTHDVGKRGRNYVLELVEAERRGENIEGQYIVSFCHMLGKMAAYKEEFEDHFLSHTAIFYSAEGDNLFRENTIGGYLRKVDEIFNKEAERVKRYDNNTMVELKKVLTEELLTQEEKTRRNPRLHSRLDAILNGDSGMVFMIENLRFEELRLMFKLLKDADGALHKIAAILNDYFEQTGTSIVSTMTSLPVDSNLPKEQILFIEKLLELKAQVDRVVSEAFSSVAEFVDLANIGFRKLVNLSEKTAECFSVYVNDRFLHKFTKMQVNEIEDAINGFVRFYEFIGAKDIFENWFKRHLARRLLGSKGVVKENEEMFISKLRNHCAFMYTKELADMFTDVEISATLTETFQADQNNMDEAERNPIGLEMKIIRSGLWPLSAPPPINLPKRL